MFNFSDEDTDGFDNLFSVDNGYSPSTPWSTPDAIKAGDALANLGFFGNSANAETDLTNGVKAFQNANGLKVDGVINPGGPTENAISKALSPNPTPSDNTLPSNVTIRKPTGTNPDERAWSASASFGAPQKPKPKIGPITGLADPLASPPKDKMPTAKQWKDAAKVKKQKVTTAVIPEDDTVQQRIQSMMMNALYKDEADKMIQPGEVEAFDPEEELSAKMQSTAHKEKNEEPTPKEDTQQKKEGTDCTSLKGELDQAYQDWQDAEDDYQEQFDAFQDQIEITDQAWDNLIDTLLGAGVPSDNIPDMPEHNDEKSPKKNHFSWPFFKKLLERFLAAYEVGKYLNDAADTYWKYNRELKNLEFFRKETASAHKTARKEWLTYSDLKKQYKQKCGG